LFPPTRRRPGHGDWHSTPRSAARARRDRTPQPAFTNKDPDTLSSVSASRADVLRPPTAFRGLGAARGDPAAHDPGASVPPLTPFVSDLSMNSAIAPTGLRAQRSTLVASRVSRNEWASLKPGCGPRKRPPRIVVGGLFAPRPFRSSRDACQPDNGHLQTAVEVSSHG
jgi:hypothetical protein